MEYKELQAKAASLGIKAVGVSKKELIAKIKEAEATPAPSTDSQAPASDSVNVSPTEEVKTEEKPVTKKGKEKANVAKVMVGEKEVRAYTLLVHGDNFAELAEEFASHTSGAEVVLEFKDKGVTCPSCGHEFQP